MTKINGNAVRLYVAGHDLGASIRELELSAMLSGDPNVTTMNDTAEQVQSPVIRKDTLTHAGIFDDITTVGSEGVNNLLKAGVGSEHVCTLAFNDVYGGESIHGQGALATAYQRGGAIGQFVTARGQYEADGQWYLKGNLLIPKTDITSFPHTGATQDNAASSAAGANGVVQVFGITAGTSIDVTIRDSNDNFVGDDNVLFAFTTVAQASAPTAEFVNVAGTVERYVRVTVAQTGGVTSAVVAVSFHRN